MDARQSVIRGKVQIKDKGLAIEEIEVTSENNFKIIKVIDDIAFQINILAFRLFYITGKRKTTKEGENNMPVTISQNEFNALKELVRKRLGIELKDEKRCLVESRLSHTIEKRGLQSFSEYIAVLEQEQSGELEQELEQELAERITTNHTYFMREVAHFDYFRSQVLPWCASHLADKELRIWSAGCSSGEEPYTLAMLLADYFKFDKHVWKTKILATDVSTQVLKIADNAVYPLESLRDIPDHWKKLYFQKVDQENMQVRENIRADVLFRYLNFIESSFPFKKKFHTIFCRNVMIYFGEEMKRNLVKKFYEFTEPGGYLFIGHSETLGKETQGFRYIRPSIYRKGEF